MLVVLRSSQPLRVSAHEKTMADFSRCLASGISFLVAESAAVRLCQGAELLLQCRQSCVVAVLHAIHTVPGAQYTRYPSHQELGVYTGKCTYTGRWSE